MNPDAAWFTVDPALTSLAWSGAMLILGAAVVSWLATACCLCCLCWGERARRPAPAPDGFLTESRPDAHRRRSAVAL